MEMVVDFLYLPVGSKYKLVIPGSARLVLLQWGHSMSLQYTKIPQEFIPKTHVQEAVYIKYLGIQDIQTPLRFSLSYTTLEETLMWLLLHQGSWRANVLIGYSVTARNDLLLAPETGSFRMHIILDLGI